MATVQRQLVHKQFNSPIGLYSDQNVKATLDRELKVLSNGTMGIDFDDTVKPANLANSAVLKMVEEEEQQRGLKRVTWPPHHEGTPGRQYRQGSPYPQQQVGTNYNQSQPQYQQQNQPQYQQQRQPSSGPQSYQSSEPYQQNPDYTQYGDTYTSHQQSSPISPLHQQYTQSPDPIKLPYQHQKSNQSLTPKRFASPDPSFLNINTPQYRQQVLNQDLNPSLYSEPPAHQQQQHVPHIQQQRSQPTRPSQQQQQHPQSPQQQYSQLHQQQQYPQPPQQQYSQPPLQENSQPQQQQQQHLPRQLSNPHSQYQNPQQRFASPDPTFLKSNTPSYITAPPQPLYSRGRSPSTAAFAGGVPVPIVGNSNTGNSPSPRYYNQQQQQPFAISPGSTGYSSAAAISPQYSASSIPISPEPVSQQQQHQTPGAQGRGWSHVDTPAPATKSAYTVPSPSTYSAPSPAAFTAQSPSANTALSPHQNYPSQQATSVPHYGGIGGSDNTQTFGGGINQQKILQQPTSPLNKFGNQFSIPNTTQSIYEPEYNNNDQQTAAQQQMRSPYDIHQSSPGLIPLRKEAPISQQSAPVFASQPAAAMFKGGAHMRGDDKWPPIEYKIMAEVENEERKKLALGPATRPTLVRKDYSRFFGQNALNATYPGYRAPPGTQHYPN